MKHIYLMAILLVSANLFSGDLPIKDSNGVVSKVNIHSKDWVLHKPFSHLIVQAHTQQKHYLLASVNVNQNKIFFDGSDTIKNTPTADKAGMPINYYLLTQFDSNGNGFIPLPPLSEQELLDIVHKNDSNTIKDCQELADFFHSRNEKDLAYEFYMRGWQKMSGQPFRQQNTTITQVLSILTNLLICFDDSCEE